MKAKKMLSGALKFALVAIVAAFLALHSINLFKWVFPADQQFYAWLGFGLTGLGAIVYLVMFLWDGTTVLQKSVSLGMSIICSIGEVLAAIFGMMIESWKKAGFTLTESDFNSMLLVIGILSIAHFIALIAYFAGDKVAELFADQDGDGIPNYRDRDYKPKQQPRQAYAQTVQQNTGTTYTVSDLERAAGMDRVQIVKQYRNREAFGEFVSGSFDYISGGNIKRLYNELMGQAKNP